MKYEFDLYQYIEAIRREMDKRDTTYPKIIAKMEKRGDATLDVLAQCSILGCQSSLLTAAKNLMIHKLQVPEVEKFAMLDELIREYKMRRKCYPRFVMFKRMTEATAEYEKWLWRELCIYFAETYLGDAQIALNALDTKTRKRKSHADPG